MSTYKTGDIFLDRNKLTYVHCGIKEGFHKLRNVDLGSDVIVSDQKFESYFTLHKKVDEFKSYVPMDTVPFFEFLVSLEAIKTEKFTALKEELLKCASTLDFKIKIYEALETANESEAFILNNGL